MSANTNMDFFKKQEQEKFSFIKENFSKAFLHHRFSLDDFFKKLKEFKLNHSWDEKSLKSREEECKTEEHSDFNICVSINENWGYLDIYYLYDLNGKMLITEITISDE